MKLIALLLIALLGVLPVYAQPTCPTETLLSFSRAASTCYALESEQACIGGAEVTALDFDGQAVDGFRQIGDRISINALHQLTLNSTAGSLPIVSLNVQANLTDAEQRRSMLLLIGTATLENQIEPLTELVVFVTGTANLRAAPQENADILARAAINESMVVNGRTQDSRWLRTRLRDSNTVAWVSAEVIRGDNLNTLSVVTGDTPLQRAFEHLRLSTGGSVLCNGALTDGLLLQSPGVESALSLTLNDSQVDLAGTFFITAEADTLSIYALVGQGVVNETFVPAGAWAQVRGESVTVAGYAAESLLGLPLSNLPLFVRAAPPLTPAQIAQAQADAAARAAQATPPPIYNESPDTTCRRSVRRDVALYAGPGHFYEAINELQAGSQVQPILQTTDPQGAIWYQLPDSNWIPAAQVIEQGQCSEIAVTTSIAAPLTNQLSMETCQTTNGPLRAGQRVTVYFAPPPWHTYAEARDAVRIDRGRITIGTQRYSVRADAPVLVAGTLGEDNERWLRRFYTVWDAVPGTYRIEADRADYNPICTITVPIR